MSIFADVARIRLDVKTLADGQADQSAVIDRIEAYAKRSADALEKLVAIFTEPLSEVVGIGVTEAPPTNR